MDPLVLFSTEHCLVSQARSFDLPGYLIVETKRPHLSLDGMGAIERGDLMECLVKAEGLVRAHTAAERVYTLRFGEESERVHFHIVPRTPEVLAGYLKSRDGEPPYSGAAIVDWLWFHHGELGHSRGDVLAWVKSVRGLRKVEESQPTAWAGMAKAATNYCAWIESLPLLPDVQRETQRETRGESDQATDAHGPRVREARTQLLAVVAAGSLLESVDIPDGEESDSEVPHDAWQEVYSRTAALGISYYREVPYGEDLTDDLSPSIGDLGDDLADTWRDLKRGLLMWQEGKHASAAWEWRFHFLCHWGTHAVDALRQVQGWIDEHDSSR